tara:strand:- start:474 stop:752 length:279 start_codon:yes stop_codon:yes gene_type:complete
MTQVFSKQQQAIIDEGKRIAMLPKSSKSIHNAEIGDLVTDGYRFYTIADLLPYNGYDNALMVLFCLEQCPNTGKWGYLEYSTTKRYSIMERK